MTLPETNNHIAKHNEPPWMERVRRMGWALLLLSFAAVVAARLGPHMLHAGAVIAAFATGSLGLLAVLNIALVRGLYKRVDMKLAETKDSEQ
ncbi:MAG: hypothetical protein AABZ45_08965 [Pseudomonadota bacterium]